MSLFSRYIIQVIFWLGIWCLLWVATGSQLIYIQENGLAFLFQILLLLGLIYYAIPQLLFNKKYLYFFVLFIPILLLCAFISAGLGPPPPTEPPNFPELGRGPRMVPSRYFIHLLMLSIASISAILLETFILAQQKEKSVAITKAQLMESELKFLKMQINPHFLFNALNNIYSLSVIDSNKTQESINTLSEMLRYVIYDCEHPKVPLQKEMDYIYNYIELFKLKSSKTYDISYNAIVSDENALVAPMLFIPFIENAFKHSGIERGKDNFVHISLKQSEKQIEFIVENSKAQEIRSLDAVGGIGLSNVQKRLKILYPLKHELNITNSDTFSVNLQLDMR